MVDKKPYRMISGGGLHPPEWLNPLRKGRKEKEPVLKFPEESQQSDKTLVGGEIRVAHWS